MHREISIIGVIILSYYRKEYQLARQRLTVLVAMLARSMWQLTQRLKRLTPSCASISAMIVPVSDSSNVMEDQC